MHNRDVANKALVLSALSLLVASIGLIPSIAVLLEGSNTGEYQSSYVSNLLITSLVLTVIATAIAVGSALLYWSGLGPDEANSVEKPVTRGRFARLIALYLVLAFVLSTSVFLILVTLLVPVVHVSSSSENFPIPSSTPQWNHTIVMGKLGEIVFNWTEQTFGSPFPQIHVWIMDSAGTQLFSTVSMYGEPGSGGLVVPAGSYVIGVAMEPVTATTVYLTIQTQTYSYSPIW